MFLTNQIAQLRVLDFTYTTSRAVSRRRKPPRTLILPTANTYTTRREYLYYLRTVYCRILEKIRFKNLDFSLSVSKPKRFYLAEK